MSGGGGIPIPNFIKSSIEIEIIKREGIRSESPHLTYVAYLCATRVPSDAMPLSRAYKGDELCEPTEQREKGIMGVRRKSDRIPGDQDQAWGI